KLEALVENQIKLSEVWSFQRIAWEIPEGPGQRNCERRWVNEVAIVIQIRTDSRKQVGSAGLTRRTTTRRIDHGGKPRWQRLGAADTGQLNRESLGHDCGCGGARIDRA